MTVYALNDAHPEIDDDVWIAPDAQVIGKVRLGAGVGIWFGTVMRGDNELLDIGPGTNLQEQCVCHTDMGFPMTVGAGCTIGHKALLHGCWIGENSLIGMGAMVMNGARIGKNCLVGAGSLITEGKAFPDGTLIVGAPAKVRRSLRADEIEGLRETAANYVGNMRRFRAGLAEVRGAGGSP